MFLRMSHIQIKPWEFPVKALLAIWRPRESHLPWKSTQHELKHDSYHSGTNNKNPIHSSPIWTVCPPTIQKRDTFISKNPFGKCDDLMQVFVLEWDKRALNCNQRRAKGRCIPCNASQSICMHMPFIKTWDKAMNTVTWQWVHSTFRESCTACDSCSK